MPEQDLENKIYNAYAKQLERAVAFLEREMGPEAGARARQQLFPPVEVARSIMDYVDHMPHYMVHSVETLGRSLDLMSGPQAPSWTREFLKSMAENPRNCVAVMSDDTQHCNELFSSANKDIPIYKQVAEAWAKPGYERRFTPDISFAEIFPEAPAESSLDSVIPDGRFASKAGAGFGFIQTVNSVREGDAVGAIIGATDTLVNGVEALGKASPQMAKKLPLVGHAITATDLSYQVYKAPEGQKLDAAGEGMSTLAGGLLAGAVIAPLAAPGAVALGGAAAGAYIGGGTYKIATGIAEINSIEHQLESSFQNPTKMNSLPYSVEPSMTDYKYLAAIRSGIARHLPDGKIDGKDVITQFKEIDFGNTDNQMAYRKAMNQEMSIQLKQKADNTYSHAFLTRASKVEAFQDAQRELNILESAEKEFRSFQIDMMGHQKHKAQHAAAQLLGEGKLATGQIRETDVGQRAENIQVQSNIGAAQSRDASRGL